MTSQWNQRIQILRSKPANLQYEIRDSNLASHRIHNQFVIAYTKQTWTSAFCSHCLALLPRPICPCSRFQTDYVVEMQIEPRITAQDSFGLGLEQRKVCVFWASSRFVWDSSWDEHGNFQAHMHVGLKAILAESGLISDSPTQNLLYYIWILKL